MAKRTPQNLTPRVGFSKGMPASVRRNMAGSGFPDVIYGDTIEANKNGKLDVRVPNNGMLRKTNRGLEVKLPGIAVPNAMIRPADINAEQADIPILTAGSAITIPVLTTAAIRVNQARINEMEHEIAEIKRVLEATRALLQKVVQALQ